jgi:hypothetical protein
MNLKSTVRGLQTLARNVSIVYKGFKTLKKTNRTPEQSYQSMRNLFVQTNGRSNDLISKLVSNKGYKDLDIRGVLGINDRAQLEQVVQDIDENGYHVFSSKLPDEMVQAIYHYAKSTPVGYLKTTAEQTGSLPEKVLFDEKNPISPRYDFSQQQIIECETLQKLIFDPSILAVAQGYLKTKPLLDLIAMWWSAPFHGAAKSEAAQMYHFDLDRIKFLKFFFYITDVDSETGPHCYVRKSHKRLPPTLLKDGRHTDADVEAAFGKENMVELCGERGSIIAVDTRGLHKGKDLTRDKRLLFQIEFANSMFGQYYPPCKKPDLTTELESQYQKYKYTYQELMESR